jgi:hypothetical protein
MEQQRSWDADGRFVCEEISSSSLNSFMFTWAHHPEPDEHSLHHFSLHFDINLMYKCTYANEDTVNWDATPGISLPSFLRYKFTFVSEESAVSIFRIEE